MSVPSRLLFHLRPEAQVPLANACAFGAVAGLAMHFAHTTDIRPGAFTVGVAVTTLASVWVLRIVFTRDRESARAHTIIWPPAVGAIAGAAGDQWMQLSGVAPRLTLGGVYLGSDGLETFSIALVSAITGLLGTLLLLPQLAVLQWAAKGERVARAQHLAIGTWGAAWMLSVAACLVASHGEGASFALAVVSTLGLLGQWVRVIGTVEPSTPATPYR